MHQPFTIAAHRNENPLGPPPAAVRRMIEAAGHVHRYPDEAAETATATVADHYGVSVDEVVLTRGVDEATDLLLLHGGGGWAFTPGFDGYWERAAALALPFRRVPLGDGWRPTIDPSSLGRHGVGFVANPNNPTGRSIPNDWLAEAAASSSLVCIDETYLPFAAQPVRSLPSVQRGERSVVFVSFSKLHGLAGLRLGALFGTSTLVSTLRRRQRFHSLDTLALAAIEGCVEDVDHLDATRHHVLRWRPELVMMLRSAPRLFDEVLDTDTNFVIARTTVDTPTLSATLGELGLRAHDCGANGLPGWLRISIGTSAEMRMLPDLLDRAADILTRRVG